MSLVLASDFQDMTSKYKVFQDTKFTESYDEEKIFREMDDHEKRQRTISFAETFGMTIDKIDEMFEVQAEDLANAVVEIEQLKSEIEDPFQTKMYEKQKVVFAKPDLKKEQVFADTEYIPPKQDRQQGAAANQNKGQSAPYNIGYQPVNQTANTTTKTGSVEKQPPNIFSEITKIASTVQAVAYSTPAFKEPEKPKGWGTAKTSFWQKCKNFMGSQKFRIMAKLGAMLSMQLFMAKLAGKYEIKNAGQFIAVIGLMMGTFYISKELQQENFDVRSIGI